MRPRSLLLGVLALAGAATLAGCATKPKAMSEQECMARAMYFESNRSSPEGMIAVGTVVMNRLENAIFPGGICAVVGQPGQFAAGVLTKPMQEKDLQKVADAADAVLAGERHPQVGKAMYFHTAGRHYPYNNMHYVAVAGGNAFYEKRRDASVTQDEVRRRQVGRGRADLASAPRVPAASSSPVVATAERVAVPVPHSALSTMTIEDVLRSQGIQ